MCLTSFVLVVSNTSVMTERLSEQTEMIFDLYIFYICISMSCNNCSLYFTWENSMFETSLFALLRELKLILENELSSVLMLDDGS